MSANSFDISLSLLSVAVGALIGFLSSIGFDQWKERKEINGLKNRIKEELDLILKDITEDLSNEAFQSRAFFTEAYVALKQDLIRKLDAKTFREIMVTYTLIDQLRLPIYKGNANPYKEDSGIRILDVEGNKKKYQKAVENIKKTIALL